jgi:hypothetical protein
MEKSLEALLKTDFGNPDGLYDQNLEKYFLDQNYWSEIVESNKFFVIGRKGTGKSAIYKWINNRQYEKGILISNLSFSCFPFENLLSLSDDNFSRPNQYQSIWKNIILCELTRLISSDEGVSEFTDEYKEIKDFYQYKFGNNLKSLFAEITTHTKKSGLGLVFQGFGPQIQNESTTQFRNDCSKITEINSRLEALILAYLKTSTRSYIIQFDQLDDNYTLFIDDRKYFEALISLFKVIYRLNNEIYQINSNVKVIAYLRSDIYNQFSSRDPDSAKFDYHTFSLNWTIINRNDWNNPPLLQLINIRIQRSNEPDIHKTSFNFIFNPSQLRLIENNKESSLFRFIIHRTFHRPRDLVQFCIKIQDQAKRQNRITSNVISAAEKEYSLWLIDELKNEISPVINSTETLFSFLRNFGNCPFSAEEFRAKFLSGRNRNIQKSPEALLRYLYELGIIQNVQKTDSGNRYYSIIRNEKSHFEPQLDSVLHSGIIKGLSSFGN